MDFRAGFFFLERPKARVHRPCEHQQGRQMRTPP